MLDSLEMSQSSSPSGKKNESNFRKDKPIFSPHQQSHNTMIITSNDNRQLIYIILHNQCPSLWASFIFPISDLCGRGKFHCSIFQKHANGPSTGHPDVNSHTFFQNRSQNTEQSPTAPDYLAPLCSGTDTVLFAPEPAVSRGAPPPPQDPSPLRGTLASSLRSPLKKRHDRATEEGESN